jgi:pSer/pThr/pTyr-binding forkhead associated (FHA) protein
MDYINVYLHGVLQQQVALSKEVTTIGRSEENDIQIDNPGVSIQHAMIVREGDAYFVMDAKSKNGTNVNGVPVTRKRLAYGDLIGILKHTLKYSPLAVQAEGAQPTAAQQKGSAEVAGTMDMDVSQLDKLLKQHSPVSRGYLLIRHQDGSQRKRPLDRASFAIGKDPMSDLVIRGWFVPRNIAQIERRVDGYYLVPAGGGKVRLNGAQVSREVRLEPGDALQVRRTAIQFVVDQPDKAAGKP